MTTFIHGIVIGLILAQWIVMVALRMQQRTSA